MLPQDIVVLLKLAVSSKESWTYNEVAYELKMSPSMVHSAVKRTLNAKLFVEHRRRPHKKALEEFLIYGVKYAFAPQLGSVTRGVPTGFASPMLKDRIKSDGSDLYVWPHSEGEVRGIELEPLYKSVPLVALQDERLYSALGALDAIRVGKAREQKIAEKVLLELIKSK